MKSKYDKWLVREMKIWEEKGLADKETIDRLQRYYEINIQEQQSKSAAILSIFGSILIALGILLILARNWDYLSRIQRVVITMLPFLFGSTFGLMVIKKEKKGSIKEVAAIFSSIGIFIALMMQAQIYHVFYENWMLFLWIALLVLPLVYFYSSTLTLAMYLALVSGCMFSVHHVGLWFKISIGILGIGLTVPFVSKNYKKDLFSIETIWTNIFLSAAGFAFISSLIDSGVMLRELYITYFIFLLTLDVLIYDGDMSPIGMRPFAFLGAIGLYSTLFVFTFTSFWRFTDTSEVVWQYRIILSVFLVLVTGLIVYLFKREQGSNKNLIVYLASAVIIVLFRTTGLLNTSAYVVLPVLFNLFFAILSVGILRKGIILRNIIRINLGLFMLSALIMARFFDSDIPFLYKGLIFIICGIVCIVLNVYFVQKHKKEISHEE